MILEVLMEMLIPFLMASIIDDGVEKGDLISFAYRKEIFKAGNTGG